MSPCRLVAASLTACSQGSEPARPYLEAALEAAAWLGSVQIQTDGGRAWPSHPDLSKDVSRDLYSGTCGVILFFLELERATGDGAFRTGAIAGADDLLHWVDRHGPEDSGLWTGAAGRALALAEVHRATGEQRFRDGALRVLALLEQRVRATPGGGARWSDVNDVIGGSAGIGLALLRLEEALAEPRAGALAVRAGLGLLECAIPVELPDGSRGTRWMMSQTGSAPEMPNYSHGTAGIADFLTALSQHVATRPDGDRALAGRFRAAAEAGGRYLRSIAAAGEGTCLIRHHAPGGEELFYLGWCHGPAGTARFFRRLAQASGDATWEEWARRGAESIRRSGIPEQRTPGFWNNVGCCCGSAGIAWFLLELPGDSALDLALARRLADDLIARGVAVPLPDGGRGRKWPHAEHRVRPDELAAQTGFMQGAAGIGLLLLRLDARLAGRPSGAGMPWDP